MYKQVMTLGISAAVLTAFISLGNAFAQELASVSYAAVSGERGG